MSDISQIFNSINAKFKEITAWNSQYPLVEVRSKVDNKVYKVRDMSDKQEAADLLARIRIKMGNMMIHLQKKFPDKAQIQRLVQNFKANPERLLEATPDAEHTSYSVNKGEKVHLCLRHREGANESLVGENVMFFVALHEMAHTITASIGHGPDFWNNFGFLLREAEQQGFYKHQDFKSQPVTYCGVSITDAPNYDPKKDDESSSSSSSSSSSFQIGTMMTTNY